MFLLLFWHFTNVIWIFEVRHVFKGMLAYLLVQIYRSVYKNIWNVKWNTIIIAFVIILSDETNINLIACKNLYGAA